MKVIYAPFCGFKTIEVKVFAGHHRLLQKTLALNAMLL